MKNWKTDKCIGISIQNYPLVFWISQIYHKIPVENACWESAFLKSRNHELSRNNFLYILILKFIFLIEFNRMVPGFQKKLILSMRFPLEFCGGFGWFKKPIGSFGCWFRCTYPFSIFYFLRVLFPPGSWRTFLVNKSMYAGPMGLKANGQLTKGNHVTIKFFRRSKILHFLGVMSEFYQFYQ